ncbi:hypothetical protein HK103_006850 [Boothiomyces macroporosus]|uniref:Uncharacterized protein n=1 Tax=Boothiomyces macroporosus TaxID=261099 RepID=A0AAD5UGU6_9FUNG|nr:hypothetical protein HK103_006850 [Boothiomyces macroporosus]
MSESRFIIKPLNSDKFFTQTSTSYNDPTVLEERKAKDPYQRLIVKQYSGMIGLRFDTYFQPYLGIKSADKPNESKLTLQPYWSAETQFKIVILGRKHFSASQYTQWNSGIEYSVAKDHSFLVAFLHLNTLSFLSYSNQFQTDGLSYDFLTAENKQDYLITKHQLLFEMITVGHGLSTEEFNYRYVVPVCSLTAGIGIGLYMAPLFATTASTTTALIGAGAVEATAISTTTALSTTSTATTLTTGSLAIGTLSYLQISAETQRNICNFVIEALPHIIVTIIVPMTINTIQGYLNDFTKEHRNSSNVILLKQKLEEYLIGLGNVVAGLTRESVALIIQKLFVLQFE